MIDFDGIRAANPVADVVARYVELTRAGSEYKARCPFHDERTPSFYVNPRKSKAFCMGCGWHGDAIDFVAEYENISLAEAAAKLGGGHLPTERPAPAPLPPDASSDWTPILPVPADAPDYDPARTFNPKRGKTVSYRPVATWAYRAPDGRLLGYVIRFEIDGQKLTPTITFCEHADGTRRWCARPFPTPRPLYGLQALAERPAAPVVVVEGEKARDAAAWGLPGMVCVTWPGGSNGVRWADFSPLAGRDLVLWPDADDAGLKAMRDIADKLTALGVKRIRWIDTDGLPKGHDAADVPQGEMVAFCRSRVREVAPAGPEPPSTEPEKKSGQAGEGSTTDGGAPTAAASLAASRQDTALSREVATLDEAVTVIEAIDEMAADEMAARQQATTSSITTNSIEGEIIDLPQSSVANRMATWESLDLSMSDKGVPAPNMDNASRLLERHPDMQGQFWYDEFQDRVYSTWNRTGEPAEWGDADDVRLALWMQRTMGIGRMAVGTARDAVTAVAMAHRRNECREWLECLRWDGTERLRHLLPIAFSAEASAYTEAVGRCWMVSMAARVLNPGCKVDTMPVFEGNQGVKKSTALEALVGKRWFAEAAESPTSKDFFQALSGKMLVEIGEMDAFSKAEVHTIKRVISCKVDRYRAPYGRRAEDHPRACVFAGTTNKDDWNRDETGARRFWPVTTGQVDVEWLLRYRDQLFAEAVARYKAGEPWWDVPQAEAEYEQEARRQVDEWEDEVRTWLLGKVETTVGKVLEGALKIPPDKWDKPSQMRVGVVLRVLRWKRETQRRDGRPVKVWVAP